MVCPNCGAQNEAGAKFCADCGNKLPEAAPVAAPMPPATPMPAAQPLPATPPPWAQPAQPAPAPEVPPVVSQPAPQAPPPPWNQPPVQAAPTPPPPPWAAAQPPQSAPYGQQPGYAQPAYPPQGYAPQPAYGTQGFPVAPAAAATAVKVAPLAALIAIAGGAIAIASGWMPWETGFGLSIAPMDKAITDRTSDLANGYYLLAGGAVAVVCGLALFLGLVKSRMAVTLLALGAIVGGCLVLAVEATAYSDMSDSLKFASLGNGLYVGIAGGAVAIVGGALALRRAR